MKKIFCYITAFILVVSLGLLPTFATDLTESEATEAITEAESGTVAEIGSEEASEIVDILEASGSKAEAIIALAEKLGITVEEAEHMITSMLEVGDKYLGETKWWVGFKATVEEDKQLWIMIAVVACAALALLGLALSLHIKFASPMKRIDFSLNSEKGVANTVKAACEENSQTLAKMLRMYEKALEQEEYYEEELLTKEEEILKRDDQIVALKEANYVERKNMLTAAAYNLRMLKLLSDRTAMPMTDKATIDLFYASGIDAIKAVLTEEDFAKIEQMTKLLDTVGGGNNGQGQA